MIVCCRKIQRRRTEFPLHVAGEGGSPPLPSCLDRRGKEQIRGENSVFPPSRLDIIRENLGGVTNAGIVVKDEAGNIKCTPIYSRIVSLFAEQNDLQFAVPEGLIGVGTTKDPTLTRADRLVSQVLGAVGSLPVEFVELEE